MKNVKVLTGTDIPMCLPSHPLSMVVQVKMVIDRIVKSTDREFQYNCNSKEGIEMFEQYGRKMKGLRVQYFINGKPATFKQVLEDFGRAQKYITEIVLQNANKDENCN